MGGIWITSGLVLCLLIPWNYAYPSPLQKAGAGGEDDDDEIDSDEQEFNRVQNIIVDRLGLKNMTNQVLAAQATQLLMQYFNKAGGDNPLQQVPNNSNHTIIITILPNSNNGSNSADGSSFLIQQNPNHAAPPRAVPEREAPVTEATTTTTTSARPTPFLPPAANQGSDNIEDAILEALSFVQGQVPSNVAAAGAAQAPTQSRPIAEAPRPSQSLSQGQSNNNKNNGFSLSAPFPISPSSPDNDGTVHLQIQLQQQPSATAPPVHQPAPANVNYQPNTPAPIVFVALPSEQATERPNQRPSGPNPLFLGLNLFGNLAEGDLGSALENTIKLAETPVVQDTTRLAAVGILHNVFQGFNCQVFGNCNRAPLKVIVP